jgi:hypothetical protein
MAIQPRGVPLIPVSAPPVAANDATPQPAGAGALRDKEPRSAPDLRRCAGLARRSLGRSGPLVDTRVVNDGLAPPAPAQRSGGLPDAVGRQDMYELTNKDKIWNRACEGGGDSPRAGDIALASMLLFHGPAMNGGVLHAVECLSSEQLTAAKAGYTYFGFDAIADLITSAERAINEGQDLEAREAILDQQYWAVIPDDGALSKSFEWHRSQHPFEYSPVGH